MDLGNKNWLWLLCLCPAIVLADQWQVTSGTKHTALLEVFTSEGCGSCPPAERWLYQQQDINEQLDYIILSFHIDYLNEQKGWIDRFAKPAFSERQKQLARLNLYKTIYTPEFVLSGESLPNWRENLTEAVSFLNEFEALAKISLSITSDPNEFEIVGKITVDKPANQHNSKLYIAMTEDDVRSHVKGGDNAGHIFNHQNLVREWSGPIDLNDTGETDIKYHIKRLAAWQTDKLKLVAFVQNLSDGYILQAVEIPLTQQK